MVKINSKTFIILASLGLIWFVWNYILIDDQKLIKKTLVRVSQQASFKKKTIHPFEQIKQAKELANNFSEEMEIIIKTPEDKKQKIYNHEELIKFFTLARSHLDSLKVSFEDETIQIENSEATVQLTLVAKIQQKGTSTGESFAQEVIVKLNKSGTEWLINRVENVEFLEK